ncbi:bis(5'-nucleosyl)-tetraphosphatase (symmetrical) YqeK [Veillonella denticariosi]|uniref:bis(5'-nucleosyl)-tetraphosphatase (symmetrical) YqeK n=1 Tax=Veillonella denticariosi TaxID=419208 RepID=UPI002492A0C2|nr:bis(5'-nucleosyl)-tetraphosphatase (symmetrical) YqeK [Veillonella denticariosi]
MLSFDEIKDAVSRLMGKKRFKHTLGVVEAATRLAERYGVNLDEARLAALLHDCAKEMPLQAMQHLVRGSTYDVDDEMLQNGALLHGLAGMVRAERDFAVTNRDVLEAIRVHTTGKVGMSKLDKIIFLADYIEPNREFPGVDMLRKAADEDLDTAVLLGYDTTLRYLLDQQLSIYPLTILGRNDILRSCK